MAKDYLGEAAVSKLLDLIKAEFAKYLKTENAQRMFTEVNDELENKLDKSTITTEKWTMTLTDGSIIEKKVMLQ